MAAKVRWAGWVCLAAALPALARDDAKQDPPKDAPKAPPRSSILAPPAPEKEKPKYVVLAKQKAMVTKVDAKELTLQVSYPVTQGIGRYARTSEKKDDLTLAEDVKVFSKSPPEQIGEDGKAKKPSPAELAKLRDRKVDAYV